MELLGYVLPFIIVLSILVFVHEWGHYWVARRCGVKVEIFSIGFGPEIWGKTDKHGTRWKISAFPLGGYVQMYGDSDGASTPDAQALEELSPEERLKTYAAQPPHCRMAISAAGPIANYILAFVLLWAVFTTVGYLYTPAQIGKVTPDSAAQTAGLQPGDRIVKANKVPISSQKELVSKIRQSSNTPLELQVQRGTELLNFSVTPRLSIPDNPNSVPFIGVQFEGHKVRPVSFFEAPVLALKEVWDMTVSSFEGVWDVVRGRASSDGLSGPLRIAQTLGDVAKHGLAPLIVVGAALSLGLGFINLWPIPALDGGHIFMSALEMILGRPLNAHVQEWIYRIGLLLVIALMIFTFWNDLVHMKVVSVVTDFAKKLWA